MRLRKSMYDPSLEKKKTATDLAKADQRVEANDPHAPLRIPLPSAHLPRLSRFVRQAGSSQRDQESSRGRGTTGGPERRQLWQKTPGGRAQPGESEQDPLPLHRGPGPRRATRGTVLPLPPRAGLSCGSERERSDVSRMFLSPPQPWRGQETPP